MKRRCSASYAYTGFYNEAPPTRVRCERGHTHRGDHWRAITEPELAQGIPHRLRWKRTDHRRKRPH